MKTLLTTIFSLLLVTVAAAQQAPTLPAGQYNLVTTMTGPAMWVSIDSSNCVLGSWNYNTASLVCEDYRATLHYKGDGVYIIDSTPYTQAVPFTLTYSPAKGAMVVLKFKPKK